MGLYLIAESSGIDLSGVIAFAKMMIGLGIVIFVHELGHFLIAKACGVKCEKFYIGFDFFDISIAGRVLIPRALFKFQYGETEYGLGIIPLGGYVKMLGQDDDPTSYGEEMERSKLKKSDDESSDEQASEQEQPAEEANTVESKPEEPVVAASQEIEEELDPRSYQAKNVPQRMSIISAGVIMNLIFAVIFAMVAYRIGVENPSCFIGSTTPGGPAYRVGLLPGDKMIQIGRDGVKSEFLRFRHDLLNAVVLNGDKRDLEILVRRAASGEEEWIKIRPERIINGYPFPVLGVGPSATTTIGQVFDFAPAGKSKKPILIGDKIVAVNGQEIKEVFELKSYLAKHPSETLTFTVERTIKSDNKDEEPTTERVEIEVAPNPMKTFGLVMRMGPILGVQPGSPAEDILETGDVIKKMNGKSIDPLTLPNEIRQLLADADADVVEVDLEIVRKKKTLTVKLRPRPPTTSAVATYLDAPWLCDELGIAFAIKNEVGGVTADGPAAKCGIERGDVITSVVFEAADKEQRAKQSKRGTDRPIDLTKSDQSWPYIHTLLQGALEDSKVVFKYKRGKATIETKIQPAVAAGWFNPNRGVVFQSHTQVHVAASWGEAFSLGVRETKESAMKVVYFLKKLVSGEISPTNLGGPFTIAYAATSEASVSTSRLLIFLTLLSANLAVVNFLPIPVLDGGHMMFLAYEGITRKKPSEKWFVGLSIAGFAFILSLMVFVLGLDVWRFAGLLTSG